MINPFQDRKFTTIYAIVWGIIVVFQILVLSAIGDVNILTSILQSIIQNGSFAIMGYGIWYVVKYSIGKERKIRTIAVFIIGGLIVVLVWMGFNFIVENLLFRMSNGIIEFKRHHLYQFIIGVFLFSIFSLSYRLLILFDNYNEKSKSEEKLKTMLTETKLNVLKAYVNPHFLFNSLNSVNALIHTNPEKAREMIVNLSEYFRYSLKQKNTSFISLDEELNYTLKYFEIEKLRFGERIETEIKVDDNVKDWDVPVMLLQPLFENVIKHAVSESLTTVTLKFIAKLVNDKLQIKIINNFDTNSISKKGNGIGLSTTEERMKLIYGNRNLFSFTKMEGVFSVILDLPKIK